MFRIYHDARSSKSRSACALIAEAEMEAEIVNYLETPPTHAELVDLLGKLGMQPSELIRRGEAVFQEHYAGRELSEDESLEGATGPSDPHVASHRHAR